LKIARALADPLLIKAVANFGQIRQKNLKSISAWQSWK
jgi:hypothetical protein